MDAVPSSSYVQLPISIQLVPMPEAPSEPTTSTPSQFLLPEQTLPPIRLKSEPTSEDAPFDAYEDEDEIEDDEAEDDPNVFKIRDALAQPTYERFTTGDLHKAIHESSIDLNPPYQRDVVWGDTKQIALIDSMFHNYYVPPIVFAVYKDEDGDDIRICVDGKQRLTSIQKFMDGQIPYRDTATKKSWYYTVPDHLSKSRLSIPDSGRALWASKKLVCMEYRGLPPGVERDIFQRVQMGMTLTMAEKLQAISSPWADWINQLESKHVTVEGGLNEVLDWDTKRGRDFQNIAYLVYCCDGLPTEQLPTNQKLARWLSRVDPPIQSFKEEIDKVLTEFWKIANDDDLNQGFTYDQRVAPVEFIFIGVLLYMLRRRSTEEKAAAIPQLRDTVRAKFKDIRNNTGTAKFLWDVIRRIEKGDLLSARRRVTANGKGKKRKTANDDDSDGDYRPSPISSLSKPTKTRSKYAKHN